MNKTEALQICESHKDEYIADAITCGVNGEVLYKRLIDLIESLDDDAKVDSVILENYGMVYHL